MVNLTRFCENDKLELKNICNQVDMAYLSNRIPRNYIDNDADFWIKHTNENNEKTGIF